MDEKRRQDIALFKYSLIAPLVSKTYTQSSAKEYLEEITARVHDSPRGPREYTSATLKGWLRLYANMVLMAFIPKLDLIKVNYVNFLMKLKILLLLPKKIILKELLNLYTRN